MRHSWEYCAYACRQQYLNAQTTTFFSLFIIKIKLWKMGTYRFLPTISRCSQILCCQFLNVGLESLLLIDNISWTVWSKNLEINLSRLLFCLGVCVHPSVYPSSNANSFFNLFPSFRWSRRKGSMGFTILILK